MSCDPRRLAVAGAISLAAHAAVSLAQSTHETDPKMPTHAPTEPLAPKPGVDTARALAGPEVAPRAAEPTLVRRTFGGRIQRLDVHPAEAALDLIQIDEDARQRAIAILDKRAAAMDKVVLDHLDLLTQIQPAVESGRVFHVLQIASQLHRDFEARAGTASLVDQLAGVLPLEDAQSLRRLVDEYWDALAAEEGGEDVGRIEAFVIERRAALEVFGKEIERAFDRISMGGAGDAQAWERILVALELSPEQERTIRAMGRDFYVESRFNPTRQETAEFLGRVYLQLDTDQRTKLFRLLLSAR